MARKIGQAGGVVVIGLGRFGKSLADELERDGVEVLAIDNDPKRVQDLAGRWTHIVQADSTDIQAMEQLGVGEFSKAVISIGHNLEASVLTAFVLRKLGVADIWAKAITTSQGEILSQVGVAHIVRPEHQMGKRVAHLVRGRMLDYIEFDDGYAIVKTTPPREILGRTLAESGVRQRYGVTIVGVKSPGEDFTYAKPDTKVHSGDTLIVSGPTTLIERMAARP